jgi:hypothetical protein
MGRRKNLHARLAAASCAILVACTSSPPVSTGQEPVPTRRELTISLPREPQETLETGVAVSTGSGGGDAGMGVGAGLGVAAAAACGAFFIVCAPGFAFAGAFSGGAAGVGVAALNAPDRASLQGLEQRLRAFARDNAPREQFRSVVAQQAQARWKLVPDSDENSLSLHVTGLSLRAVSLEEIALELRVVTVLRTRDPLPGFTATGISAASSWPQTGPGVLTDSFAYRGSAAGIDRWMDSSGEFLSSEIARGYETVARQIVTSVSVQLP